MNKLIDWKNRLKKGHMLSVICVLLIIVAVLGIILYKKQTEYRQASENSYNAAFYEVVNYVQNVDIFSKVYDIFYTRAWGRNINEFMERS